MAVEENKPSPVQVQKYLEDVDYPASKDDLVKKAQDNGAPDEVVALLRRLPSNEFGSPMALTKAIGTLE
ncbi:MAG TPA: DUF2795 domain-containing protein [Trueperaceae bacterium]